MSSAAILQASEVTVRYGRNTHAALADASLEVHEGASIGLVGESGSGKTTLARVLVGSLRPSAGSATVGGSPWSQVPRTSDLRRRVQMIYQDPYGSLNPSMSAVQAVAEVFRVWDGASRRLAISRAEALLNEVGLGEEAYGARPSRLSGGQCQRIGIARALACEPSVLIADEPTSSLDVSAQAQILSLLQSLRTSRNLALVFVSHDLGVVHYLTDHTLVMYGGRIVERGATEAVFSDPTHPYTRALLASLAQNADPVPIRTSDGTQPTGCVFSPRCTDVEADCLVDQPPTGPVRGRETACLHPVRRGPSSPATPPVEGAPLTVKSSIGEMRL